MKILALAILFMASCSTTTPIIVKTQPLELYDGLSFCAQGMLEKNQYWLEKYRVGDADKNDLVELIRSNSRFQQALIGRIDAYKECKAIEDEESR